MSTSRAAAAVVAAVVLGGGCTSYRVASTMQPREGVSVPADVRFSIAAVRFLTSTNVASGGLAPFGVLDISDAALRERLMQTAMHRYPRLFGSGPGAVPLEVAVTREAYANDVGGDACVACLTLTILPLRSWDKTDYRVAVRSDNAGLNAHLTEPVLFSRVDLNWMSVFPTGWIPVPGGTGRRVWGMDGAIALGGETTLASCVDAIVTALDRVAPAGWSAVQAK